VNQAAPSLSPSSPVHVYNEWDSLEEIVVGIVEDAMVPPTGVPQLITLLGRVAAKDPCSERFGLVRNARRHRYTVTSEVLARLVVL